MHSKVIKNNNYLDLNFLVKLKDQSIFQFILEICNLSLCCTFETHKIILLIA